MYNYTQLPVEQCDFAAIGPLSELRNGERVFVEINGSPIVVFNIAGEIFAIGDVCSHDDGPLGDGEIEGLAVVCPRHGARFDVRTGKALALPAYVDIPAYPVRITEGQIEVGAPKQT
jgi:3-phenylpropionate/trans-cinnamate dioxygenase ferredoxin subunit